MNASFRTAFWAMCLGFTVPMVLFVGVELTSGGRSPASKSALASVDHRGSLRAKWGRAESKLLAKKSTTAQSPGTSPAQTAKSPKPENGSKPVASQHPRRPLSQQTPAAQPADPGVSLEGGIETEQLASDSHAEHDRRVPAVATGDKPRAEILPGIEPLPAPSSLETPAIEARLASIQHDLDRLGRALATQTHRETPDDPVKQAGELLKQLRQARALDRIASQFPVLQGPEADDDKTQSSGAEKKNGEVDVAKPQANIEIEPPTNKAKLKNATHAVTKIYRPRYLSGSALLALAEPLLTADIGKAGAADAATDAVALAAGSGTSPAPVSAVVVHDFPEVLQKISRLMFELDIPPIPVALEATVITVCLNGAMPHGINLEEFNSPGQPFAIVPVAGMTPGLDSGTSPGSTGVQLMHGFGLKCGVLSGDPRAFISVLQAATQAPHIESWQMTVLNRQAAQLMLHDPFGPEGSVAQSSAGTLLKVRPLVGAGGRVDLDVRREIDFDAAAAGSRSAALINHISLNPGQTAVVAGYFAEHLATHIYRTSVLGKVPVVGSLFRKQAGVIERCETIILLTPHIVGTTSPNEAQVGRRARSSKLAKGQQAGEKKDWLRATGDNLRRKRETAQRLSTLTTNVPLHSKPNADRKARTVEHASNHAIPTDSPLREMDDADADSIPEIMLPNTSGAAPMIRPAAGQKNP